MDSEKKLQTLRKVYAGALADSVRHLGLAGVLEQVTAKKREEQLATGKAKAAAFGLEKPEDAFTRTASVFDCADWTTEPRPDGFQAVASRCVLCALAKAMKAPSPCRIYCLDPLEGMVRAMDPSLEFVTEETLYEGRCCSVRLSRTA